MLTTEYRFEYWLLFLLPIVHLNYPSSNMNCESSNLSTHHLEKKLCMWQFHGSNNFSWFKQLRVALSFHLRSSHNFVVQNLMQKQITIKNLFIYSYIAKTNNWMLIKSKKIFYVLFHLFCCFLFLHLSLTSLWQSLYKLHRSAAHTGS